MSKGSKGLDADLFVDASERDPLRAVRQSSRPPSPKRFYETAAVAPTEGGYAVLLDGKPVKTPAKRLLALPAKALAEAIASEWAGQGETIDPGAMPLTRIANSVIDGVAAQMPEVEAELTKYAGSDLICYRAGEPASLVAAQGAAWDPLVGFARDKLGARLALTEGVIFSAQQDAAVAALTAAVRAHVGDDAGAPFRLGALHVMTTLTGSLVVALAAALREIDLETAWAAAHVDEDFQTRAWGEDAEALARRSRRFAEMRAAAFVSESVTPR